MTGAPPVLSRDARPRTADLDPAGGSVTFRVDVPVPAATLFFSTSSSSWQMASRLFRQPGMDGVVVVGLGCRAHLARQEGMQGPAK